MPIWSQLPVDISDATFFSVFFLKCFLPTSGCGARFRLDLFLLVVNPFSDVEECRVGLRIMFSSTTV